MAPHTSSWPISSDSDKALDQWVRNTLADAYGGVANERLPEEWVRMLGEPSGE